MCPLNNSVSNSLWKSLSTSMFQTNLGLENNLRWDKMISLVGLTLNYILQMGINCYMRFTKISNLQKTFAKQVPK